MTNDQMKPNRFARWASARRRLAFIRAHLEAGRTVYASTYGHHTKITAKHIDLVKATKTGLYIQHGKNWLCYDGAKLSAQ